MRFRPCIDLHGGKVKQIVGSSLRDNGEVTENYVSAMPPSHYADMYYRDGLSGGHVIMLGKGNEDAAREALGIHPGNLQIGGGITCDNAREWLDAGASKVIVTSFLFENGELSFDRLAAISAVATPERLVLDLSCVKNGGLYHVACNRWQTICAFTLSLESIRRLADHCSEFLVHAVQVEGKQGGIDAELVEKLAEWCTKDVTYAGGIRNMADVEATGNAGNWKVDFTVGSALDIFGGNGMRYSELAACGSWSKPA